MGIYDSIKDTLEIVGKVRDAKIQAELQQKILNLQQQIADLQEKAFELRGVNDDLMYNPGFLEEGLL